MVNVAKISDKQIQKLYKKFPRIIKITRGMHYFGKYYPNCLGIRFKPFANDLANQIKVWYSPKHKYMSSTFHNSDDFASTDSDNNQSITQAIYSAFHWQPTIFPN